MKELRCIHRHTIKEHPGCFMRGKVKFVTELTHKNPPEIPWYKDIKIGFFDIESDGLKADFATMLSWCIKMKGGSLVYDVVTKDELFNGEWDKRIIETCVEALSKLDIVVGYYSKRFDLPFVRAKALHYNIPFLWYNDLYHWDLYDTVKAKLCLSRRSLDNACDFLGIVGKTPLDKEVWRRAKYGDKESLKLIVDHNIADTEITEKLFDKLEMSRKWTRSTV